MYGLFLMVCHAFQPCDYQPQGYVYPDYANCAEDIRQQHLPAGYTCLPVDAIIHSGEQKDGN